MNKGVLVAAALVVAPVAAQSQSLFEAGSSNPGFYIGAQGGLNWLLNSNNYNMDLG